MSLKTAKDFLDNYKKDTAIEYINACTFLELLVDFEQSSLEEVLTYLNLKSFPTNTNLYVKKGDYISPRAVDKNDCKSTCNFFNEIEKIASFSVIMGFSHEIRERYATYYFSLADLFQSNALYNISFIEKYAAHQAMGRGYCYISKITIGNLFKPNDLVTGLPKKRMEELLLSQSIVEVKVDSSTDLTNATDMQKIAMAKIHEYMDAQMNAYNSTPTHSDEISKFFNRTALNTSEQPNQLLTDAQNKIAELEKQLSKFQTAAPDVVNIPFGKRIDFIDKNLPQSERIKQSYEIYSDNMSFHEDMHPVNTPDEMIKRIQGLLKVIKRKDSKILELEQQTNAPAHAQAEIDELKEQLSKASAELAAAKTTTTDQPLDWQNMSEHIYPPELHLAMMIWRRIYVDNELKDSHITSHGGKFKVIAKKLGLNPDNTLGRRVAMLINTAHSKNKQDELADPLRAIEQLYMPPKKEKTTS